MENNYEHVYLTAITPRRIHNGCIPQTVSWSEVVSDLADPYYDSQLARDIHDVRQIEVDKQKRDEWIRAWKEAEKSLNQDK